MPRSSNPSYSNAKIVKPSAKKVILGLGFCFDSEIVILDLGSCFAFEIVILREELSWVLGTWKKRVEWQLKKKKKKDGEKKKEEGRRKEQELEFLKLKLLE